MPRPCEAVHPEFAAGCRLCWLARHDARYMRLWGIAGEPEPVPEGSVFKPAMVATSAPCAHAGPEVGGAERQRLGLDHRRRWLTCDKGHGTGGVVCTCHPTPLGCRGCPDYSASPG